MKLGFVMNPSLIFRSMYEMDNQNNFITDKISVEFAHSFFYLHIKFEYCVVKRSFYFNFYNWISQHISRR